MISIDYNQLLNLIPPTLGISIFLYLINFFGKIIADQIPFTDDRKWYIQLSGVTFMINMVFGLLIGVYLALLNPWGTHSWWLHLISVSVFAFIAGTLLLNNQREGSKIYGYRTKLLADLNKKTDGFISSYARIGDYLGIGVVPIILFYFVTLEYLSGNIYWIISSFLFIFVIFTLSALGYSFKKIKDIVPVDIYFTNEKNETLRGVKIIKINEDNMRVRADDTIQIINNNEVLKIEMKIPEKIQ